MSKVRKLGKLLLEYGDSLHAEHVKKKIAKIFDFPYGEPKPEDEEDEEEDEEDEDEE